MFLYELLLDNLNNARFGSFVKVVLGTLGLFVDARLHLLDVHGSTVFCEELLALHAVKFGALLEEWSFKVFLIDGT